MVNNVVEQDFIINKLDKILQIFKASEAKIRPHFLLTGPSGSGKSHIVQRLARTHNIPYLEINAAQLTKEGASGNSLSKALVPLENMDGLCICFVDEFDKIFVPSNNNSDRSNENTVSIQNEFLKVVESEDTSVFADYGKFKSIKVNKVLFVFAGAFNNEPNVTLDKLRSYGVKTEFLGRVGLIFNIERLSLRSLYAVLLQLEMFEMYLRLFPSVDKDAVAALIMDAVATNYEHNTLGVRILHTLLNQYFINDGVLDLTQVESNTFQHELKFKQYADGVAVGYSG